jgi:hypothetical protein
MVYLGWLSQQNNWKMCKMTGVQSPVGIHICFRRIQTGSGALPHPIQWAPLALLQDIKRLGRETDHSSPPSSELEKIWNYISFPHTLS